MDFDGRPEQHPVTTEAATKASEGRKKPDVLPAEDADEGHKSVELEQRDTEPVRSIQTLSSATLLALQSLPGEEDEVYEELELDEAEVSMLEEPLQQPCCRKPPRFWCLLTVGLATIIAIVLVGVLTGNHSYNTESFFFYKFVIISSA